MSSIINIGGFAQTIRSVCSRGITELHERYHLKTLNRRNKLHSNQLH